MISSREEKIEACQRELLSKENPAEHDRETAAQHLTAFPRLPATLGGIAEYYEEDANRKNKKERIAAGFGYRTAD